MSGFLGAPVSETLFGGTGDDALYGYAGEDTLYGFDSSDRLDGGLGADRLFGGNGDDILVGAYSFFQTTLNDGNDTLTGGAGADIFVLKGTQLSPANFADSDTVTDFSIADGDRIDLRGLGIGDLETVQQLMVDLGDDVAIRFTRNGLTQEMILKNVDPSTLTSAQFIFSTTAYTENIVFVSSLPGSADSDLFGGAGNDRFYGGDSSDRLFGELGDDLVEGAGGADSLFGGGGNDVVVGGFDADRLFGGSGDDTLIGDSVGGGSSSYDGNDTLTGGAGADVFVVNGTQASATSYGSTDTITDFSSADGDRIDLSGLGIGELATVQQLLVDLGADSAIRFTRSGTTQEIILKGIDDPSTLTAAQFIFSTEDTNALDASGGGSHTFGGAGDDTVNGNTSADTLFGDIGNDLLIGSYGADRLFGGANNDRLIGGFADGVPRSSDGNDTLTGGAGADVFVMTGTQASAVNYADSDTVTDFSIPEGDKVDLRNLDIAEFATVQQLLEDRGTDTAIRFTRDGLSQEIVLKGIADPSTLTAAQFLFSTATTIDGLFSLGNSHVFGGAGNDTVSGSSTNDTLFGDVGADSVNGAGGADDLFGGSGDDVLVGGFGADRLFGGANNDTLIGDGADGNSTSSDGNDTLTGGAGADIFVMKGTQASGASTADSDTVTDFNIAQGDRIDLRGLGIGELATVQQLLVDLGADTAIRFTRDGQTQEMILQGIEDPSSLTAAQFIFSTDDSDYLIAPLGVGPVFGGADNDTVYGSISSDILFGDIGADRVEGGSQSDLLFGGSGNDTLVGGYGADQLFGGANDDRLIGDYADGSVRGNDGNDTLTGGAGADVFVVKGTRAAFAGTADSDTVTDFSIAEGDRIDLSGLGIGELATVQQLLVDLGDDIAIRFSRNGQTQETILQGIADTNALTEAMFIFSSGVTNVVTSPGGNSHVFGGAGNTIVNGSDYAETLFGDVGGDTVTGRQGNDHLFGGSGVDLLFGDSNGGGSTELDGNDTLFGGAGGDLLTGGGGNDLLTGGAGNDSLAGGDGTADTAVFSGAWVNYQITSTPATTLELNDQRGNSPDGTDSVSGVEFFRFSNGTFSAFDILNDVIVGVNDTNASDAVTEAGSIAGDATASGNVVTNDTDADAALGDTKTVTGARSGLETSSGALTAVSGSITLTGTYGSLLLNANGSYTYTLNNADPDTQALRTGVTAMDTFTYRVADARGVTDLAQLAITITGANDGPVISSNGGGATAAVSVAENTTSVTSVAASDADGAFPLSYSIAGGADAARFTINAATGALAFVALPNFEGPQDAGANNVYNLVVRVSDGSLSDTQALAVTVTNSASGVTITGTNGNDNIGPGLALAGQPSPTEENDVINGRDGNDTLNGGLGNDTLLGGVGNDTYIVNGGDRITENANQGTDTVQSSVSFTLGANLENLVLTGAASINGTGNTLANRLTGNSGNNTLNGAGGTDTMLGGKGNDTYVTDGRDTITENARAGTDLVQSSVTYTLGANVEKLTLTGSASINGTGNSLGNTIVGNTGKNTLNGSTGNDTLTGGSGSDSFIFNTALGLSNVDRITDFNVPADTIRLEDAIFTGLANGALALSAFASNISGNAADASDRIIYERDTGMLFFDKDGSGGATKVHFATISTNLALTSTDFFVF